MRMQTKLSIVTVVGAGALLLCALAVIFTLRAQTAYAQDTPSASISLGEFSVRQGDGTMLAATLKNLPNDPNNPVAFPHTLIGSTWSVKSAKSGRTRITAN